MIHIRRYLDTDQSTWDDFVAESNNGTMFNYRKFLSYHMERSFEDHSLIIEKNRHIIAVFPAAVKEEGGKRILFSHPGASFGGFIFSQLSYSDADGLITAFENYVKAAGFNGTFFIPVPQPYYRKPDETLEYALLWRGYGTAENYISSLIELTRSPEDHLAEIYRNKNRSSTYFRTLIEQNNLRLEWNKDFDRFYPILVKNKKKHNSRPTHSQAELKKLDTLFPDQFHLLVLYKGDRAVGGTLNFVANERVAIIFYNMIDYQFADLQPATLQVIETIEWGYRQGFQSLDFGVSQDPQAEDPLTPSKPLIRFKEELTSRGMLRKVFCKSWD